MGNSNCRRCFTRETEKSSEIRLDSSQELKPNLENSNTLKNIPEEDPKEFIKEILENNNNNINDKENKKFSQKNQNKNNSNINNDILGGNKEEINYDNFDDDSSFLNEDKIQSRKNVLQKYRHNSNSNNDLVYIKGSKQFNEDEKQNFNEKEEMNYEEGEEQNYEEEENYENRGEHILNGDKLYDEGEGEEHTFEEGDEQQYNSNNGHFEENVNNISQEEDNDDNVQMK